MRSFEGTMHYRRKPLCMSTAVSRLPSPYFRLLRQDPELFITRFGGFRMLGLIAFAPRSIWPARSFKALAAALCRVLI